MAVSGAQRRTAQPRALPCAWYPREGSPVLWGRSLCPAQRGHSLIPNKTALSAAGETAAAGGSALARGCFQRCVGLKALAFCSAQQRGPCVSLLPHKATQSHLLLPMAQQPASAYCGGEQAGPAHFSPLLLLPNRRRKGSSGRAVLG